MAKITVTTDDGEVVNILTDKEGDIGDLTKQLNRSRFVEEVAAAVRTARQKDRRKPNGDE